MQRARSVVILSGILLAFGVAQARQAAVPSPAQVQLGSRGIPIIEVGSLKFRDLNRDGALAPYEDWRLPTSRRVGDLVSRMTLEEKAGVMMHGTAPSSRGGIGQGAEYDAKAAERLILALRVNSLITRLSGDPSVLATQNNLLQEIAERSRLGIPLTVSTDPRNHFQFTAGASVSPGSFAQWPETLGFAALRDPALVRTFADMARREYRAVGIHEALSPQADLATEPRWSRITGTFGEDPDLARDLVRAYVEGFQHGADGVQRDGVICIVKHWVGYGAAVDGYDGHNYYGRYCRLDGALDLHIRAFAGAFAAKVAGVMPTYTILQDVTIGGTPLEPVGGGFNRQLLTDVLRGTHGFDGVILSDWGITRDCGENCRTAATKHTPADIAMPWGVESLTPAERFVKGVLAGLDQFGGVEDSPVLVDAVRKGALTEARLDESVRRILTHKYQLGLFENPFVEPQAAARVVGAAEFRAAADAAQRRAIVPLENSTGLLPLKPGTRVWLYGVDADAARAVGLVPVGQLQDAGAAVVRMAAPYDVEHPNHFFGGRQHEGRLDFRDGDTGYDQLKAAASRVPTVVSIYLDRPVILGNVRDKAAALLADFGASDAALLDVLVGRARAEGRLPFALPASMADVTAQSPGKPHDLPKPQYPFGAGGSTDPSRSRGSPGPP
jgi:beta-glucosidase